MPHADINVGAAAILSARLHELGHNVTNVSSAIGLTELQLRRATRCHRAATRPTTLLYIGSDLDTWPLNYLKCHEKNIVFIDPLVWWRNAEAMMRWYDAHPNGEAHRLSAFPGWRGDDGFYECPPSCGARALTNADLQAVGSAVKNGLLRRQCPPEIPDMMAALGHESALSGLSPGRMQLATLPSEDVRVGRVPALTFEFESQRVHRTFSLYTAAAEAINYSAIFGNAPVSTLIDAGASGSHREHALAQLCRTRGLHGTLREISTFPHAAARHMPTSRKLKCRDPISWAWDGGELLGCGCPYSGRNQVCYGLAKHRSVL